MRLWTRPRARARSSVNFANIQAPRMKQINVFPMLIMLVVVLVIIAWFGGYLT
jgi:hypothetical protein